MNKRILTVVESFEITIKSSLFFLFIFVLSIFMISCKSTEVTRSSKKITVTGLRPIYITNTKKVNLLLPEYSEGVIEALQLLNGSFGTTSFNLLSYSQVDATGISLSLMNDFEVDMGNVFFDGSRVIFDSAYFPKELPGEYIICDIQNAYYKKEILEMNYKSAGLLFEETKLSDSQEMQVIRKISDGNKLIEEITILENTITIKNFLRGYEYNLMEIEE